MLNLSSMKIAILFFDWRVNVPYVGSDDRLFYVLKSYKLNVTHSYLEILVNVLSEGANSFGLFANNYFSLKDYPFQ